MNKKIYLLILCSLRISLFQREIVDFCYFYVSPWYAARKQGGGEGGIENKTKVLKHVKYFSNYIVVSLDDDKNSRILCQLVSSKVNSNSLTCHNIQPYTNATDIRTCTVSQITMFIACVRSNSSLPFLMHKIASETIMAPYTQHCVPTRLHRVSVTYV